MQFLSAIGVVLLGLSSTALRSASESNSGRIMDSIAPDRGTSTSLEIEVLESENRWYSQNWNEFLGIDGEWEEIVVGQSSVLRPANDECSIGIYTPWKEEVVYFPFTPKGEVIIDAGWILVNQLGQSDLSAGQLPRTPGTIGAFLGGECTKEIDAENISEVIWGGNCWEEEPSTDDCTMIRVCRDNGTDGCSVDFVMGPGARFASESYGVECGVDLSVSRCVSSNGKTVFCIDQG